MILILSEEGDKVSDRVCEWLLHWGKPFLRLNDETAGLPITDINFQSTSPYSFYWKEKVYPVVEINSVWFRRGYFRLATPEVENGFFSGSEGDKLNQNILDNLNAEKSTLINYCYSVLLSKRVIGNPHIYNINKLKVLNTARRAGLNIPPTLVTNNKVELENFKNKYGAIITKNIQEGIVHITAKLAMGQRTQELDSDIDIPNSFFYSLFQKKIEKQFELRIFILEDKFFAAAIFSQGDERTTIDSRNAHATGVNTIVPFNLPEDLKPKLLKMMQSVGLNCGSADMIVDENGEFIFLEINPVGQFEYVSSICNYNIEKHVAEYLAN
jgi:ATP-GRASP peptide maturase of grasp-with-spasm system